MQIKFLIKPVKHPSNNDLEKKQNRRCLHIFKYRLKTQTIRVQEAYLLFELFTDV